MKKPSERKPESPPDDLVVFIDRSCGGKKLPAAFRDLGFRVEVQTDHFPDDASDVDILTACGKNGWIYVTQDFAVRRNPSEVEALRSAGIHALFIGGRRRSGDWAVDNLRQASLRLMRVLRAAEAPLHIEVQAGGRLKVVASA